MLLSLLLWIVQTYDIRTGRMAFYFVMPVAAFLILVQFVAGGMGGVVKENGYLSEYAYTKVYSEKNPEKAMDR